MLMNYSKLLFFERKLVDFVKFYENANEEILASISVTITLGFCSEVKVTVELPQQILKDGFRKHIISLTLKW